MRIEDMPRPWLLAAVTGVPMAELLRRAKLEDTARPELPSASCDEEMRLPEADRDALRAHWDNVVSLPSKPLQ